MPEPLDQVEGLLVQWNDARGFGFVRVADRRDVFVHISTFPRGSARPQAGDTVVVGVAPGDRSRPRAVTAALRRSSGRGRREAAVVAAAVLVAAAVVVAALLGHPLPLWVPAVYALASALAFALYAADKRAAERHRWRTPESTLLLVGLLGGWPGAMLAQRVLRHKRRKAAFMARFRVTVVVNVVVLLGVLALSAAFS